MFIFVVLACVSPKPFPPAADHEPVYYDCAVASAWDTEKLAIREAQRINDSDPYYEGKVGVQKVRIESMSLLERLGFQHEGAN